MARNKESKLLRIDGSPKRKASKRKRVSSGEAEGKRSDGKELEQQVAGSSTAEDWEARAFERIKLDGMAKKNLRWHVLIPSTRHALRVRGMKCVKLGAMYPSPEYAARAADIALIALWGRLDSEDYLNFPLHDYDESMCYQRYGGDLTRYMIDIVEMGKKMVAQAKSTLPAPRPSEYFERLQKMYHQNAIMRAKYDALISEHEDLYKFHKNKCGVCVNCRQPWLGRACLRYKQAKDLGYKFREHAKMIVDGPELSAFKRSIQRAKKEGKNDIARKITNAMYAKYPLPDISKDRLQVTAAQPITESSPEYDVCQNIEKYEDSLEWLMTPFPNKMTREYNRKHTESAYAQLRLYLSSSMNQEIHRAKKSALEYDEKGIYEFQIKRKRPGGNVYDELLGTIDHAAASESDILFVREDARTWLKPSTYKLNQCSYCKTWHKLDLKICPFMRATCAVPKSNQDILCRVCRDGKENCKVCLARCTIPEFLCHPLRVPAPFLSDMSPEMLSLLSSIVDMSSAAISEFKSPHLSGKLTPKTLLALAIVTEAMVDSKLERLDETS